ncbi:unnamed protein product [Danaus chrysippus]|uniref:(African queen) hypothetical protein n=1 Tax=Danaus chrysippus TaxID=151541 RepID=A0A8J2VY92_9NEOP|nr:unnamed protein product [Danaus chrysippus]
MDSSSIVSFNNDSTYQSTLKGDSNNISVHELALHAMRDRCLLLQRRINTLETDNMRLKLDISKSTEKAPYIPLQQDEKSVLQQKIAELNKQKSQLLHHVFMVSCENKNLWSKLSLLKNPERNAIDRPRNPLVRTNTYIHSTPKCHNQYQEKYSDSSLEEISLKLINSYIQEKSQLVEQYEQMAQLQDIDDDILNVDSIGFTYIEDPAMDSLTEIRNHTDKLQQLKKELAQQEKDLQLVLSRLETIVTNGYKCATCLKSQEKNTNFENKETETSNSLNMNKSLMNANSYDDSFNEQKLPTKLNLEGNQNFNESFDRICPICGEKFKDDTMFSDFQTHVENHFIGENEVDSIDNYDTIPNSLDNVI